MKKYYYVKTDLEGYEEIIVYKDDPEINIVPHLLIWNDASPMLVDEHILIQITHRKVMGVWYDINLTYTYLMDHNVILVEELVKHEVVDNKYPPGFHLS